MKTYYVNKNAQSTGEHEVHAYGCSHMPNQPLLLGAFNNCIEAIAKARQHYTNVDGCFYCCEECHKK